MPQTQDSSPEPHGTKPAREEAGRLVERWSQSKGLDVPLVCKTTWLTPGRHLSFKYLRPGGEDAGDTRYFDLEAWDRGDPYKFWVTGSQAKGSTWRPTWSPPPSVFASRPVVATTLLLCEGETDALAALQHGAPFDEIWAVPGAHMVNVNLTDELTKYQVTLAFDYDDAGHAGVQQIARLFGGRPLERLVYRPGVNDLRDDLNLPNPRYERTPVVQAVVRSPAPKLQSSRRSPDPGAFRRTADKPDLNRIWDVLSPRSKGLRKDGQGRSLRQAWCPLHEDGAKPAAWVGETRWGCFACGIESADVYELVAWVRGFAVPGSPLTGDSFLSAKQEAERIS